MIFCNEKFYITEKSNSIQVSKNLITFEFRKIGEHSSFKKSEISRVSKNLRAFEFQKP